MEDLKSTVQTQFGDTAENYRHSQAHAKGEELSQLIAAVKEERPQNILDVGCGAGHASITVAPYVPHVVALDVTPNMLEQVQILAQENKLTNIDIQLGDVENLPLDDAMFDMAITRYSGHHWPNPVNALAEISRVLKPNGRLIVIDIVGFETYTQDTFLQCIELLRDLSHVKDYRVSEWENFLSQTGFKISKSSQWLLTLDFDSWVKRMNTPQHRVQAILDLFKSTFASNQTALAYRPGQFSLPAALLDARKSI